MRGRRRPAVVVLAAVSCALLLAACGGSDAPAAAAGPSVLAPVSTSAPTPAPPPQSAVAGQPSSAAPTAPSGAPPSSSAASAAVDESAEQTEVVRRGEGTFRTVPGGSTRSGSGPVRRYRVEVEDGLGIDVAAFASTVDETLADPRSWGADGRLSFQRVSSGPVDIRIVLAGPATADRLCLPLHTAGIYSCGVGSRAVINSMRWLRGAEAYEGHLAEYRQYVVNHEVGHTLGHHHASCPGPGGPAPVMMQQTKGVGACRPVSWPFP